MYSTLFSQVADCSSGLHMSYSCLNLQKYNISERQESLSAEKNSPYPHFLCHQTIQKSISNMKLSSYGI